MDERDLEGLSAQVSADADRALDVLARAVMGVGPKGRTRFWRALRREVERRALQIAANDDEGES